jgi:hypothetical protein
LNRRSDFRLKVSVVDDREEWRRNIGDFVFCFLKKGEDPGRGYPKLVTAAGGVRHRGVDPSITYGYLGRVYVWAGKPLHPNKMIIFRTTPLIYYTTYETKTPENDFDL